MNLNDLKIQKAVFDDFFNTFLGCDVRFNNKLHQNYWTETTSTCVWSFF